MDGGALIAAYNNLVENSRRVFRNDRIILQDNGYFSDAQYAVQLSARLYCS